MPVFALQFLLASALLPPSGAHAQSPTETAPTPSPTSTAGELDSILANAMSGAAVPALGVLVMRDGAVAGQAVRGVRRNDRAEAVGADDPWLIGSTGKPITAALVAKLVDRGVVAWDDTLAELLPPLASTMRPEYRTVTLLQLLSHRSGLSENLGDREALDAFFTDRRPLPAQRLALVGAALAEAPEAAPGSGFLYSNTGFLVAAAAIEHATGATFEDLMRDEVFAPLGMAGAGFGPVPETGVQGHRAGKPAPRPRVSADGVPMVYTAAGNLHMPLADWARFCLDQLAGSRGKGALLKPASYAVMQTAQPGSGAGLDWGVQDAIGGRKGPVLVHGGSDGNWQAWVVLFPEAGSGILVIANAGEDMGADKVTHAVVGALLPTMSSAK